MKAGSQWPPSVIFHIARQVYSTHAGASSEIVETSKAALAAVLFIAYRAAPVTLTQCEIWL